MGIFDFLKRKEDTVSQLKSQVIAVQNIVSDAFDQPGPMYNPAREQILGMWFSGFVRNLDAAVSAIERGIDMSGNPITKREIALGLRRMCEEYSRPEVLQRLQDVCGMRTRRAFEEVLKRVRSISATLR